MSLIRAATARAARDAPLACVLAVVLGLGAARWGSYLGAPPLYLTDLLVFAGLVNLAATTPRDLSPAGRARRATPVSPFIGLLVLLILWALVRFILTPTVSIVSLRDFVPYGYAVVGIASGYAVARSTAEQRSRTARLLERTLYFHAGWVALVVVLVPNLYTHLPLLSAAQNIYFFEPRPDFDEAISGAGAALMVIRAFQARRSLPWLAAAALTWISILELKNRGGLLGAAVALAIALYLGLSGASLQLRRKLAGTAMILVLLSGAGFVLPRTAAYQRLVATFTGSTSTFNGAAANGTASARRRSWERLLTWDTSNTQRSLIGVGFGPNFMIDSGASTLLVGGAEADVRSPHNYWLGTYSREGLPGVALFGTLVALLIACGVRVRRIAAGDTLVLISLLVCAAIIPPASVGVILESPFGAVPFFWCAGVLLAYPHRARWADPDVGIESEGVTATERAPS